MSYSEESALETERTSLQKKKNMIPSFPIGGNMDNINQSKELFCRLVALEEEKVLRLMAANFLNMFVVFTVE